MLLTITLIVGAFAAYHVDTQSSNILYSTIFPVLNAFYVFFLLVGFTTFLRRLNSNATKRDDVDIVDLAYDVLSLLYEEFSEKHSGRFEFAGRIGGYIEDLVVFVEIILVFVSFFLELRLLAGLLA